ncbi:MAG TPA: hypothetical protein VK796_00585 [Cytophaga sp.]|nr:hypothetical protein [Cytophaga sp.]
MSDVWNIVIGAAGPILTLAITRFFDNKALKKGHVLALSKEFFLRKLLAFEKATAYYTVSHLTIGGMSNMFKIFIKDNVNFDEETSNAMMKKMQENLEKVTTQTQELAMSLPLYTDIQLLDSDDSDALKYIELLGEIGVITTRYKLYGYSKEMFEELGGKINALYETSKQLTGKYKIIVQSLRAHLLKYE